VTSLTSPARPVKASREKVWHANISNVVNHGAALRLTSTEGNRTEVFHYFVEAIPADFGLGFHLEKFANEVEEGEPSEYHVLLAGKSSTCECKGWLRWGHRKPCKHLRSLAKLHAEGKLPPAPCHCGRPAVAGGECLACSDAAADRAARRHDLDTLDDL
jgi:hypothetical protein